jgi:Zn-dependent protease/CBS domain-containing protein
MTLRPIAIARIAGIEIRVHASLIAVVALVTLAVATQPGAFPADWPELARYGVGGILGLLFLVSILIHELAHGLVARRYGMPVRTITLGFLGGVTAIEDAAQCPRDEAAVAGAGPLVSVVVGLPLAAIGLVIGPAGSIWGLVLTVLGFVNIALGLLNLVPAMPLDGGRLLHAAVWRITRDPARAGHVTAVVGRLAGAVAVGGGLVISLAGDSLTGFVILISGWFVMQASRVTERRLEIERLLTGVRVGEVMERDLPSIGPGLTVDTFAEQLLAEGERTSVPVLDDGALVGVLGIAQLRKVARRRWPLLRASDVMVARPALPSLTADAAAWAGMELLRESGLDGIPVMAEDSLLGVLTRRSIVAAIQARAVDRIRTAR